MDFSHLADIRIIDGHVHFRGIQWAEALLQWMDQASLARINVVSTPNLATVNQNSELVYLKTHHPGRFYASGGLDYLQVRSDPARMSEILGTQIHTLKRIGFDGVKLIEGKPTARKRWKLPLDAPEYQGMWTALEELQMPIVCHVADPETFWDRNAAPKWALERDWFYGDGTFPTKEALYAEIDRVLSRHSTLKLILAHFYFLSADLDRAARFLDAHPSVCLDITPGSEMYNNFTRTCKGTRAFFLEYQDRIIYGTDVNTGAIARNGIREPLSYVHFVRTFLETQQPFAPPPLIPHWMEADLKAILPLHLPSDVLLKIYHANFERLYGTDPAPLSPQVALAEVERIADEIDAHTSGAETKNPARDILIAHT